MSKLWPARIALAAIVASTLATAAPAYAQEPPVNTLTIGPMDPVYQPLQMNGYTFTAKAGTLQLKATQAPGAEFHVMLFSLDDPAAQPPLPPLYFSDTLNEKRTEATVQIPADGDYMLVLTRRTADQKHGHGEPFTLTGPGVQASSLYVPTIELRNIESGQAVSQPLTVQAGILHGGPAKTLTLMVSGTAESGNLLKPDGSLQPFIIDPATLAEGLHFLVASADVPQGLNGSMAVRTFVVDRLDSFTDVPRGYWGRTPIEALADEGVLKGHGGGKFDPEAPVTREEFAKMFALVNRLDAPQTGGAEFADIPADAWSRTYVQALAGAGLIKGERVDGVDYFRPQRAITRAEAATMIGRLQGVTESTAVTSDSPFTDFAAVPDYAKASVTELSRIKWLNGFMDGTFRPGQSLTRAEAAKLLAQSLGI